MNYFAPINVGGIQQFTQGATPGGWYRLPTPEAGAGDTLPGIAVPEGATAVLMQTTAAITYGFSPSEVPGVGSGLQLGANESIWIPGRTALADLVILVPGSGANITFQFYSGDIGPSPTLY